MARGSFVLAFALATAPLGVGAVVSTARADGPSSQTSQTSNASDSTTTDAPPAARDGSAIEASARAARKEGNYAFCTKPRVPLRPRDRAFCAAAAEVEGCEALVAACAGPPPPSQWFTRLAQWLAPAAKVLLYLIAAAVILLALIPIINALRSRRRSTTTTAKASAPNEAVPYVAAPEASVVAGSPEGVLAEADLARGRGEHRRALGLYLAASLTALDRAGRIRLARHRTNGEYVRENGDERSGPELRAIVREVERVEFGGSEVSAETTATVAGRATTIVRTVTASRAAHPVTTTIATTALALMALTTCGCGGGTRGDEPSGDELPIDILNRNGFHVTTLETSLTTIPIPDETHPPPLVVLDMDRVALSDEAEAHLLRWVEGGGVAVFFGNVGSWPRSLGASANVAAKRDLVVLQAGRPVVGARVAHPRVLDWKESEPFAFLDVPASDERRAIPGGRRRSPVSPTALPYAASKRLGEGYVFGVASNDLLTNVGVLPPHDAEALVAILEAAADQLPTTLAPDPTDARGARIEVRVAREADGVAPPSNPFSALVSAGLAKGLLHGLVATALLFLCFGIRHARARTPIPPARRAFAEHVEATGTLYHRAKLRVHALAMYGRFVEMRVRERLPHGTTPIDFLSQRAGVSQERATALYARATSVRPDDEAKGDELETIAALRDLLAALERRPPA